MPVADLASDPLPITRQLETAVREAGALALQKFRSPFKSWIKGVSSPVSEVDIAVDELLRERLSSPEISYGWLSEESVDDPARLQFRQVWIVDPIDGTRGFIDGRPDWAVSAALIEDGRPIAAALFAPAEDNLFLASAGHGATLNGAPLVLGGGSELGNARVAGPKRRMDELAVFEPTIEALPKVHSLALRLARVAAGTIDVAFAGVDSHDWDIAAADLIVHEAGGLVTTLNGEPPSYNRPSPVHPALVAANPARHARVIALHSKHKTSIE